MPWVGLQCDGAHGIGVQNVTSNCNVATLNSFFFLYLAKRLASGELSFAGKIYENRFLAFNKTPEKVFPT